MTYSLNTLNADRQSSGATGGVARFAQEIALVLGAAALAPVGLVRAQSLGDRPLRIILPLSAGSGADGANGLRPSEESDLDRNVFGTYAELSGDLTDRFFVDGATRLQTLVRVILPLVSRVPSATTPSSRASTAG